MRRTMTKIAALLLASSSTTAAIGMTFACAERYRYVPSVIKSEVDGESVKITYILANGMRLEKLARLLKLPSDDQVEYGMHSMLVMTLAKSACEFEAAKAPHTSPVVRCWDENADITFFPGLGTKDQINVRNVKAPVSFALIQHAVKSQPNSELLDYVSYMVLGVTFQAGIEAFRFQEIYDGCGEAARSPWTTPFLPS